MKAIWDKRVVAHNEEPEVIENNTHFLKNEISKTALTLDHLPGILAGCLNKE